MTGNLALDAAISLGAIALMVGAIWAAFRTKPAAIDLDAALGRLAFDEPDFQPRQWLVDDNGGAALAENDAGEFGLVFQHGADLVTRRFGQGAAKVSAAGNVLAIGFPDIGLTTIELRTDAAELWARKLSGV